MTSDEPTTWRDYEEVSRYLLESVGDLLGLSLERVEGKQTLVGDITDWQIDAKGVKAETGAIVVVECKHYPTYTIEQGEVARLAWTVEDLGASGGIIVTPIGVQNGGQLIAQKTGIQVVRLDANATSTDFMMSFLGKIVAGRSVEFVATATGTGNVVADGEMGDVPDDVASEWITKAWATEPKVWARLTPQG